MDCCRVYSIIVYNAAFAPVFVPQEQIGAVFRVLSRAYAEIRGFAADVHYILGTIDLKTDDDAKQSAQLDMMMNRSYVSYNSYLDLLVLLNELDLLSLAFMNSPRTRTHEEKYAAIVASRQHLMEKLVENECGVTQLCEEDQTCVA